MAHSAPMGQKKKPAAEPTARGGVSVRIPAELRQRVKVYAAQSSIGLTAALVEVIEAGLKQPRKA